MHAHRNFWKPAAVGCYWSNPAYPLAVVNTTSGPDGSGYAATVNYVPLGIFATRQLAQQAVEAYLGEPSHDERQGEDQCVAWQ